MPSRKQRGAAWLCFAFVLTVPCAFAQGAAPQSDTDARIRFYKARLGGPGTYPAYARLGASYIQKGRETGRQSYYDEAVKYLSTSLGYQRNFEALLWLASAQLARHEFREALNYAQEAVETMPTHLSAQGVLFDSYLALGDFQNAEAVAEKMLSLKVGFDSYGRLAAVREYRGNLTGAVEAMEKACGFANGPTAPVETRAWCEVRLGSLHLLAHCATEKTEAAYQRALQLLPDYHRAIEHLAELRAAQSRHNEAIALYHKVLRATADPTYRLALADVYDMQGSSRAAGGERKLALAELRNLAKRGSRAYLRLLALLLLDGRETAAEGLYWAIKDWENRRDAYAADTLAWAHYQNGNTTEALESINEALRPGLKDSTVLLHAAWIHLGVGQHPQAQRLVEQARACPPALRPGDRTQIEKLQAELRHK
jgi:tetratricopeptide (TPR) repeat protein